VPTAPLNRLEVTGAHLLGAALTKASDRAGGYGYKGYGYGYGYGYGRDKVRSRETEILMIPQAADS